MKGDGPDRVYSDPAADSFSGRCSMQFDTLERRLDPRTAAFLPIRLRMEGAQNETPAHLLDLSSGGAAILTTRLHSPALGACLDLCFQVPFSDGGSERETRRETGVVVNVSTPERGISRLGVRFLRQANPAEQLFDPLDALSEHRRSKLPPDPLRRWETARHFAALEVRRPETATVGV